MLDTNFPSWPSFTAEEGDAVKTVLLSNKVNYWTGNEARSFESEFADYVGCDHAIALANGTVALDLCLKCVLVSENDEVIVTPRTFIASVSSIVNSGAKPIFADVDLDSQNISVNTIRPLITENTRAIVVVHLAGMPADMDPIMELARKHGIVVIEDCAQAHGAMYKGRRVGSLGHLSAWSFCQDKIMTTGGEGGMVTTNNTQWWNLMWSFKDHGKSWDTIYNKEHSLGFRWIHDSFGTNWRMTEIQAAIGRLQLKKMSDWNSIRRSNQKAIWDACSEIDWIRVPKINEEIFHHAAYKTYVFVVPDLLPNDWNRDRIISEFAILGIPVFSGTCSEVYLEKAFDGTEYKPKTRMPNAKQLGETSLMFLCHPTLERQHITKFSEAIKNINKKIMKHTESCCVI